MQIHRRFRLKRQHPGPDDPALLERARRGDPDASEGLVRAHYAEVYAAACHLLGNPEDAMDLTQDCFVKALAGLRRFRGEASFRGWLRRILVHLARDRFRGRERDVRPLPAEPGPGRGPGPAAALGRAELGRLVDEALRTLPPNLRVPLVLRALEGWGYDEIAAATGVTAATARNQVMKARRRLHRRLDGLFEEDAS